ncbi:hypothetical protein EJK17_07860 [Lactobacillus xujianguonis]|uniref:Holin n=1 Tax=Lactobacillus xujianguonis TaxID=2495899 RepID=A0A437SU05_9LACO|nr:hypothetical protein [Lactobacillus xujianguonis]RVU70418.1 hypothetical protein EJK17_07860 [Lactobacillus xujianguonis]
MTVTDYLELGFLGLWIVCLIGIGVLSHVHFKNAKAEKYRSDAVFAMKKWVSYYDKQSLDNSEKANGALNDVVVELRHKGYTIDDNQVKNLEALREWELTQLRLKQAQAGLDNTVTPDTTKDVPADAEVLKPTVGGGTNA